MFSNIDLNKLIDPSYIFEITPAPVSDYLYLAILFILLIAFAFIFLIIFGRRTKKFPQWGKIRKGTFNLFLSVGIIGLVLLFFRWQQMPYLGSRFFMLILLVVFLIWGGSILYYRLFTFPKQLAEYLKKKNFEKYLP